MSPPVLFWDLMFPLWEQFIVWLTVIIEWQGHTDVLVWAKWFDPFVLLKELRADSWSLHAIRADIQGLHYRNMGDPQNNKIMYFAWQQGWNIMEPESQTWRNLISRKVSQHEQTHCVLVADETIHHFSMTQSSCCLSEIIYCLFTVLALIFQAASQELSSV